MVYFAESSVNGSDMKICPTCQLSYPNNYANCPADGSPLQFTDSIGHKFSPPLGRSDFDAWRKAELIAEDLIAPAKQGHDVIHVFGLTGRGLEAANKLVGWRGFRKAAVG